jgi:serine/threonine protein kinase
MGAPQLEPKHGLDEFVLVAALRGRRVPTFVARAKHDPKTLFVVEHLVIAPDLQAETVERAAVAIDAPHARLTRVRAAIERPGGIDVVSDFIDGESLVDLQAALRNEGIALPLMCALRLICDMLSGLNALCMLAPFAASGHGALSPHNVIVGIDGRARLVEILRDTRARPREHAERFLAPELLAGGGSTPASDIYAMGVMLAEVLGNGNGPPSGPSAPFLGVARRACSAAPSDRFASAGEMLSAIVGHFRNQIPSHADVARLMASLVAEHVHARRNAFEAAPTLDEAEVRLELAPPPSMPVTVALTWPMDPGPISSIPPSPSKSPDSVPSSSRQTDRPPPGFGSVPPQGMAVPLGAIPQAGKLPFIELVPPPPPPAPPPVPLKPPPVARAALAGTARSASKPSGAATNGLLSQELPQRNSVNEPPGSWRYASASPVAPPRAATQPILDELVIIEPELKAEPTPQTTPGARERTPHCSAVRAAPIVQHATPVPPECTMPFHAGASSVPPSSPSPMGLAPMALADLPPMRKQVTTAPDLTLRKLAAEEREQRSPRLVLLSVTLILVGIALGVLLMQTASGAQLHDKAGAAGQRH